MSGNRQITVKKSVLYIGESSIKKYFSTQIYADICDYICIIWNIFQELLHEIRVTLVGFKLQRKMLMLWL